MTSERRREQDDPDYVRGSVGSARVWDEATRAARRQSLRKATDTPTRLIRRRRPGEDQAGLGELAVLLEQAVAQAVGRHFPHLAAPLAAVAAAPPAAPLPSRAVRRRTPQPGDEEIQRRLEAFLTDLDGETHGVPGLRGLVEELVLAAAQDERGKLGARTPEELEQVDLLQRRIGKLDAALEAMRRTVAEVNSVEAVDSGLASIYRDVQGLSPGDARAEARCDMLEVIFQANLELQKSVG